MNDNKIKYINLCSRHNIPLFSQYFWMDAVCGEDNWDVILIEENGNILGSLVYFLNKLDNGYEIRKAPLTQNNGIIFFYPKDVKYDRRLAFENKVVQKVIDELEDMKLIKYRQYFHHSFTNWLPFYWRGYSQTTRYTYIIEDTSDMDKVYKNFNGNIRNFVKKAEKIVRVERGMDCDTFYELNKKTYDRQGIAIPYSFELFKSVYNSLQENKSLEILYSIDKNDDIHGAALFATDSTSVYYLMSGMEEKLRDSQSLTLLIYEGIKLANKLGKSFDFEGSMKKNIESFFRQFGGVQKPYFDINKNFVD